MEVNNMENANVNPKISYLARMALFVAIILLLMFTPLGYITIGPIAATTIQMPVIIGAVLMGPAAGAALGFIFGVSAVLKVLMMPGTDIFATTILNYQFFLYVVIAVVPRFFMGWLSGLLGAALCKGLSKAKTVAYGITGFVGSMLNTVFYLGALWLLASGIVAEFYGIDISGVGSLVLAVATTAGIPEAIVSCVVVAAVCRALQAMNLRR